MPQLRGNEPILGLNTLDSGVTMVKDLQSSTCPLLVHHQEVNLIVVVLPGNISSLLSPQQRRQKMSVLEFSPGLL